jgi:hypothetical protein
MFSVTFQILQVPWVSRFFSLSLLAMARYGQLIAMSNQPTHDVTKIVSQPLRSEAGNPEIIA